jgi:hypothetical protein
MEGAVELHPGDEALPTDSCMPNHLAIREDLSTIERPVMH